MPATQTDPPDRPRCVAFVSQCLGRIVPPHANGSIAIWTYEVARRLSRSQPVLLLELGERAFGIERAEHDGATYVYLPTALNRILNALYNRLTSLARRFWSAERRLRQPAYASVFHNLGFILQAAWQARRWGCDVIHVHNFSQFVPVVRALNPSARIFLHMNCEWLSQHDPRMIAGRLKHADIIIGCSGHVVRQLLKRFPELEPKCCVVHNGTEVPERQNEEGRVQDAAERGTGNAQDGRQDSEFRAPSSGFPLRILFVGRISPEKGVHLLAEAFAAIADQFPTARLDLVGGAGSLPADFLVALSDDPLVQSLREFCQGDYLAEVKRRIPERLKDRVTFYGNQPHRELAVHYRRATVFVNPSLSDAFPLTVVEAMAAGLPMVASAVGGVPEAVVHETTGLLVKPNSSEALASGLSRLLGDSMIRQRMSEAARERALRLFCWQAIADELTKVYGRTEPPHRRRAEPLRAGGSRRERSRQGTVLVIGNDTISEVNR